MIVRILGEGRYDVPDAEVAALEELDSRLTTTLDGDDETAFAVALAALVDRVRQVGSLLPADDLQTSGLVVPHAGASLAEVRSLLSEET